MTTAAIPPVGAPTSADGAHPTATPLRVAVVGAGVSGVATARALGEVGVAVTLFESAPDVGGVWSASRAYPGIATQDDRRSYAFAAAAMPDGVAEHPAGADVRRYLEERLRDGAGGADLRLDTRVVRAEVTDDGAWSVESDGPTGRATERFDWLVAANGVFSTPHVPVWSGREAFEAAGGRVVSPGSLGDGADLDGARTVVVGWGKTACDIAAHAAARSTGVQVIARTLTWKYPKRIGRVLTFRHLVLTRAGERLLGTRYRSADGRLLLRRIPERLPRVLLGRAIARAVDRVTGLSGLGLRPTTEVRTSNSLVTDGFFEAVAEGRIRVRRERTVSRLGADHDGPWVELDDGTRLGADLVVAATGYEQGIPFLAPEVVERGRSGDALLLHNRVLAVDLPRLALVGWAHSYRSPLTSEIAATWLAGVLSGAVALPSAERQRRGAARFRITAAAARTQRTSELPSVTLRHLDGMLAELGAPLPLRVRLGQIVRPTDPADYAAPLRRALDRMRSPVAVRR